MVADVRSGRVVVGDFGAESIRRRLRNAAGAYYDSPNLYPLVRGGVFVTKDGQEATVQASSGYVSAICN
jgi:hypothetical protein